MNETETTSLMNKKVDDITVGDALKINLVIIAAMAAIPVALIGVEAGRKAVVRLHNMRENKKSFAQKFES